MDVRFTIDPGPIAGLGEVVVRGTTGIDPAVVRSFIYSEPGDPYSPKAVADIRRSVAKVEALGSVRVREGEALDAQGNLPIFVDVTERDRNLIGVAARFSTVDGPGIRAYYVQPQSVRRRRDPAARRRHLLSRQRPLRCAAQGRRDRFERAGRQGLRDLRQAGSMGHAQRSRGQCLRGPRGAAILRLGRGRRHDRHPAPVLRHVLRADRRRRSGGPLAGRARQGRLPPRRRAAVGGLRFHRQPARPDAGVPGHPPR